MQLYLDFNSTDQDAKEEAYPKLNNLKYDSYCLLRKIQMRFHPDDIAGNKLLASLEDLLDPAKPAADPINLKGDNRYSAWRTLADQAIVEARRYSKMNGKQPKKSLEKNMAQAGRHAPPALTDMTPRWTVLHVMQPRDHGHVRRPSDLVLVQSPEAGGEYQYLESEWQVGQASERLETLFQYAFALRAKPNLDDPVHAQNFGLGLSVVPSSIQKHALAPLFVSALRPAEQALHQPVTYLAQVPDHARPL